MNNSSLTTLATILACLCPLGCATTTTVSQSQTDTVAGDAADDTSHTPSGLTSLATAVTEDVAVELFAAAPLVQGWQQVYYRVQVAGQGVTAATLVQRPVMKMMSMAHSCPVVQPDVAANGDGLFVGQLLFQMASSADESWTLALDVTAAGGAKRTVTFPKLQVASAPWTRTLVVGTGMMAERYTVILHFPAAPGVGMNDYRAIVHHASADLMTFAPVTDAVLTTKVEMPSMGHGSANNVDPTHAAGGFYEGKVNFTMPGDWRLSVTATVGGKTLGEAVFDLDL